MCNSNGCILVYFCAGNFLCVLDQIYSFFLFFHNTVNIGYAMAQSDSCQPVVVVAQV
jgi:hypothetical protein